jgi:lipoprotein-anchoring transpeptidase ErfK/SrfK
LTPTPTSTPTLTPTPTLTVLGEPPTDTNLGSKWIDIQLSTQTLTAYENDTPVLSALVSTGVPGMSTPVGKYAIIRKVRSQVMSGPGYYLPNVEFVAYFYRGYAIHGTYWHNNFGRPMSHGCVNMTNPDAEWLYNWAPKGTTVRVRQ